MNIADYLTAERIRVENDAQSKKRTLEILSQLLGENLESPDQMTILTSLTNREKLGSTGLGDGVAIPHGRIAGLEACVGAFMRLEEAIDYDSSDGKPVDLVFGLLVPEDTNETHLEILAGLAEMFTDDAFCTRLRSTSQPGELMQLFNEYTPETANQS